MSEDTLNLLAVIAQAIGDKRSAQHSPTTPTFDVFGRKGLNAVTNNLRENVRYKHSMLDVFILELFALSSHADISLKKRETVHIVI